MAASHDGGPDRIAAESANSFSLIPRTNSLITTASSPHLLARWNWQEGKREELYPGENGPLGLTLSSVQVSPDGKWLACQRDGAMHQVFWLDQIFEKPSLKTAIHTWLVGSEMHARFSPDSRTIAVPYHNKGTVGSAIDFAVWLHDVPKRPDSERIPVGERIPVARARTVAFSPDGRQLALSRDTGIVVWDVSHRSIVWEKSQADISEIAFSPDGKFLVTAGSNRLIIIRNADDGSLRHQLASHRRSMHHLAFAPNSATLATASLDGVIKLGHVPTGQELLELRGPGGGCHGLQFAEDGRHLLALVDPGSGRHEILVFWAAENDPDE